MTEKLTIAVTGAGGFIGRHTVAAARGRGHTVRACVRSTGSAITPWQHDPQIETVVLDLAGDNAAEAATAAFDGVDAVIHAAAAMSGDDDTHARNTVQPTQIVVDAITRAEGRKPRLVLVSSISVYGSEAVAEDGVLDETAARETAPAKRDAYCRSKLGQEDIVLGAAVAHNLEARIMRPGAVFGPDRIWNGHLGHALGPVVVRLESKGEVPVSFVDHCAEALVLAAELPITQDDREGAPAAGRVEIINVIDDDRPDRKRYMKHLRQSGWPRAVVPSSWRALAAIAKGLSMIIGSKRQLPGLLRPAILRARMMPLRFTNTRLHDRLGWRQTLSFEDAMHRSITTQQANGEASDA